LALPTVEEVKASWVAGTIWDDYGIDFNGEKVPNPEISDILQEALKELDPHQETE